MVLDFLPDRWTPEAAVIDGMFLINCTPLRHTSTVADYATFLFNRFVSPHYRAGAAEVHLVFDTPNRQPFNPKCYEQKGEINVIILKTMNTYLSFLIHKFQIVGNPTLIAEIASALLLRPWGCPMFSLQDSS